MKWAKRLSLHYVCSAAWEWVVPGIGLTIAEGVERQDGRTVATNECPWLRLDVDAPSLAGRWVKLTYISGLLDPLARPILRCFVGDAHHDEIMPGALFGRAIWLGRIPEGATAIWLSPTNQRGPFAFAVERLRIAPRAELLWDLFRQSPGRGAVCLGARVLGLRHLARLQVKRTLCATPLRKYDAWRKSRSRPFDPTDFDRQAPGLARKPHIRLIAQFGAKPQPGVLALAAQLSAQPYPHWSLAVVGSVEDFVAFAGAAEQMNRIVFVTRDGSLGAVLDDLEGDDFVAEVSPADLLPDYALAALARAACDHPGADVLYGDEDFIDDRGRRASPRLKPDWSPTFLSASRDLGAAGAIKVKIIRRSAAAKEAFGGPAIAGGWLNALDLDQCAIRHIRRVLRTRPHSATRNLLAPVEDGQAPLATRADLGPGPRASIIIPTRDRLDLLRRCVESLKSKTRLTGVEILIADNGSVREACKAYLAELARDQRFRVLSMSGPFNFSRLCNQAALQARAPFLVFINNDTEIGDETWLDVMLAWATNPHVGAVGAKLAYPGGGVQHAGIIVGIDGRAGHFERGLDFSNPGYFGRLGAPHEVSAVTAACLAIEAKKFFAVDGFDEINLPVELNDVDLCLRLGERGWKTICLPAARLIHRESASRGASVRPDERYREEHAYFRARWLGVIRDDPHFHPSLSLDALHAALG